MTSSSPNPYRNPYLRTLAEPSTVVSFLGVRLIALLQLAVVVAVAFALASAGLPVPAAIGLALLLVGGAATLLGPVLGKAVMVSGMALVTLAGLFVAWPLVHALPGVPPWLIVIVVLAAEVTLVVLGVRAYGRSRRAVGAAVRRRLAATRGWAYLPELPVVVPGPVTASRLLATAPNATQTTGTGVLRGEVGSLPVLVFDRARSGGRPADGVQTVYLVRLPTTLPFIDAEVLAHLGRPGVEQFTADPAVAQHLLAPLGEVTPAARALPRRWWIEGAFLVSATDGTAPRGAGNAEITDTVDRLTSFAAQLDWRSVSR